MTFKIYKDDIVEILKNDNRLLLGKKGVVIQSLSCKMAIVGFPLAVQYREVETGSIHYIDKVFLPWSHLKVLDRIKDSRFDELEDKVIELEDSLVIARSCLSISEEMRDKQHELIQKLIEEIDVLNKEIYHLKGNWNEKQE